MHNWSDEELDRISREAAKRYTPPVPEGGWDALSRRLDVEMPRKDKKRRFFWLFFAGLLLTGGAWWLKHDGLGPALQTSAITKPKTQRNEVPGSGAASPIQAPTRPVAQVPETTPSQARVTENTHTEKSQSSNTAIPSTSEDQVVHGRVAGTPKGKGADPKSKVQQHQGKVPLADAGNREERPVPARSVPNMDGSETSVEDRSSSATAVETPAGGLLIPNESGQPKNEVGHPAQASSTKTSQAAKDSNLATPPVAKKTTPSATRKQSRWEFTASIAPDLSTVEFYPVAQMGYMAGAGIGYHLSERWTLNTGLYYTVKHYDAPGDAYHLPPGYWTNNPYLKMNTVEAVCNMWDIPLNIRYDLTTGKKQRFFVSTGISSYLMRKEDLHYYYTYNNNPNDRSYVYKKNTNYWMAIGNISAGFEQQLGKGFSLQAEPFAKLSLSDVGYGKVKLNSYGLFVGLKYRPYKSVHPHH